VRHTGEMPELPDVEAYRRFFIRHAEGRTVRSVEADPTIVRNATPAMVDAALRGRRFGSPERLGKWLVCWTDGPALLLHFGMTGEFVASEDEPDRHRHDRLVIAFEDGGELRYRNMRKLGGAWLVHDADEVRGVLGSLGPDALGLSKREFMALLARRRGGIKAALMDQSLLAGVGNLIADETLWQARIHPSRRIEGLTEEERAEIYGAMRKVLRESVEGYDVVPRKRSWLLSVRGHPGAECPRCGTPLSRAVVAGRTTYFCPTCQPGG